MIPAALKTRIAAVIAGGAVAIASVTISWFEGTHYVPYQDPVGVWTVCDGITGPIVLPGRTYTKVECEALKRRQITWSNTAIDELVTVPLTETERAALIDFIYNVGRAQFANSTLLRKLNAGDHPGACGEYKRWKYADGKVWPGLINRREVSTWLCEGAK